MELPYGVNQVTIWSKQNFHDRKQLYTYKYDHFKFMIVPVLIFLRTSTPYPMIVMAKKVISNGNGKVEPMEQTKEYPCFEAKKEQWQQRKRESKKEVVSKRLTQPLLFLLYLVFYQTQSSAL